MSDRLPTSTINAPNISITLGGESLSGWQGLQVIRCIDAASDAFAFSIPFDPTAANRERFRPFKPIVMRVFLDDELLVTGYIEQVSAQTDGSNRQIEIQGRSATGVLLDWSAGPPFEFSGMTFNAIAKEIAFPYTVVASPNTPVLADVSIDIGQSIYDFLYKLGQANGYWPQPTPAGELVFSKISSTRASVADLVEGESPVISIGTAHDVTKRFQTYTVISQNEGSPQAQADVNDIELLGANVRGRVITETEQESADLREAALIMRSRAVLDSYNPSATVTGWTNGTKFWTPGDIVRVSAPGAFINRPTRMIIRRATMALDDMNGQVTQLDLGLPQVFDGTNPTRSDLPWVD